MLKAYLKERYPEVKLENYIKGLNEYGFRIHAKSYGFFTYIISGDALIIGDIYVKMGERGKKNGWKLLDHMKKLSYEHGCYVIVGFSENTGKNKDLGKIAMKASGFIPALELNNMTVYFRGTY